MPAVFLGIYDSPGRYALPDSYSTLRETIEYFQGSFLHQSVTAQNGMSAASVFSPLWSDFGLCLSSETPLECEFRLHRPSIVLINLGMNWPEGDVARHTELVRRIVQFSIDRGALPVLGTRPDSYGEAAAINQGIAQVATDYGIPFWNCWRALQPLPNHGVDLDRGGGYLTVEAWDVRSFSALRMLDALRVELEALSTPAR